MATHQPKPEVKTLVIDNFRGDMTEYENGDINSGRGNVIQNFGANPFVKPGNLTWNPAPVQIDPNGSVITDMVVAMKENFESGVLYVYAIGHTGRLYKIQVNNPATFNPDYDNPVLLTTLSINSPTFTRGGSMEFYENPSKIYIGHDKGVTKVNTDGTNETFVGNVGTWTQNVPRPSQLFAGSIYFGNGSNIAQVDSTLTVVSYTKLSPGFPANTQVRDIDLTPDGNYMEMVVSQIALPDITATTQDISSTASGISYIFMWNGSDVGTTAFKTYPSFGLNTNIMFGSSQYLFGYDQFGHAIYDATQNIKILTEPEVQAPLPNGVASNGNLVSWVTPFFFGGTMQLLNNTYGSLDREVPPGYWTNFAQAATSPETDIIRSPSQLLVSNFGFGSSSNGYPSNQYGTAKIYYSTLETSSAPTTKYRFYKWSFITTFEVINNYTPQSGATYQTQTQLFSKKVTPVEVRVYGQPWVAGNSFIIDLIGSNGNPISGASKTFTAGTNLTVGNDFAWYNPTNAPTYAIALRITQNGTTNHVIHKVEIDYAPAGK